MLSSRLPLFLIPLILLLPGCASYQTRQLKHLSQETAMYDQTNEQVTVRIYPLNKRDANKLFDGRGYYLFSKKQTYYPIQITVFNKSNETVLLLPENIELAIASKPAIIKAMEYDVGARTAIPLAIGILGVFARIAAGSDSHYGNCATTTDSVAIGASSAIIAGDQNAASKNANASLTEDIDEKVLSSDGLVIKPFDKNTTLIFVEKPLFKTDFSLVLQRANGNLIPFDVHI